MERLHMERGVLWKPAGALELLITQAHARLRSMIEFTGEATDRLSAGHRVIDHYGALYEMMTAENGYMITLSADVTKEQTTLELLGPVGPDTPYLLEAKRRAGDALTYHAREEVGGVAISRAIITQKSN